MQGLEECYPGKLFINGQYIPGSLYQYANQRVKFDTTGHGIISTYLASTNAVSARNIALQPMRCPVIGYDTPTHAHRMIALAYGVSRFYIEPKHPSDINSDHLMVSAASIIANLTEYSTRKSWNDAVLAFKSIGIQLNIEELNRESLSNLPDDRMRTFLQLFGQDVEYVLTDTKIIFAIACMILLATTKNATGENFNNWMLRKCHQFLEDLGDKMYVSMLTKQVLPNVQTMKQFANKASVSFDVRKMLFSTMVAISKSQNRNFVSEGIKNVINMMRFTEMIHLLLLDKYIVRKYPELMHLNCMQGFVTAMNRALRFLLSINANDRPFTRLLYDKDVTSPLDTKLFYEYIVVAKTVANYENGPIYQPYVTNKTDNMSLIAEVTKYLMMRTTLKEEKTEMSPNEKELFYQSLMSQFETNIKKGLISYPTN